VSGTEEDYPNLAGEAHTLRAWVPASRLRSV
jgi:hypothetical protein